MTERILRQIPCAVLAALILPALVRPRGDFDLWQPQLLAGSLAGLVSWKTRDVGMTLLVGMAVVVVIDHLS